MIRKKIKDGINLYMIQDKKFKAFRSCVLIHRPLNEEEVTKNTLLVSVLERGSKNYPDLKVINEELENMYGAGLIARASKYGERQIIKIGIKTVSDSAAPGNFSRAMKLLKDLCLNAGTGEGFLREFIETEKKNLSDAIAAQKNDKRSYSVLRLQQEMCSDEAYGINPLGYIEDINNIDESSLYEHYKKILAESRIDIIFTGNFEEEEATKAAFDFFDGLSPRKGENITEENLHHVKEVKTVTDKMDVTQGKLCLGFRCPEGTSKELYPAVVVYNTVFGGSATSKLFENVREKLSLCYYVSSSIDRLKEIMIVRSGVEFDSFEKAYNEILSQNEAMTKGEISEEELSAAKKQLINAYQSNYDSVNAMEEYYTMQLLLGTDVSIDEMAGKIEAVTKEEITAVASKMELDTVYRLENE